MASAETTALTALRASFKLATDAATVGFAETLGLCRFVAVGNAAPLSPAVANAQTTALDTFGTSDDSATTTTAMDFAKAAVFHRFMAGWVQAFARDFE